MTKCSIAAYPNSAINTGHGRRKDKSRRMRTYVYICVCACVFVVCVVHGQIHSAHLFSFPLTAHTRTLRSQTETPVRPPLSHIIFRSLARSLYQNTLEEEALILLANRKTALRIPVASACRRHAKSLHITVSPPLQHHPLLPLPLSGIHTHIERKSERARERESGRE
jgi:hypothetical protein